MSESQENTSIIRKVMEFGEAKIDSAIRKARADLIDAAQKPTVEDADLWFGKAVTEDPVFAMHSSGWKEKPQRLQNENLKAMSKRDSIIAAIIQTRQNQVSNFTDYSSEGELRGWRIVPKDRKHKIEQIVTQLSELPENKDISEWKLTREAKKILKKEYAEKIRQAKYYIENCGTPESQPHKPFYARQWNFETYLRAIVRDSLTYDLYASEIIPSNSGVPAYFFPVDGATIRFSSNRLADYNTSDVSIAQVNLLFPESEATKDLQMEKIKLDSDKLDKNQYKYVQVVKHRIERAYTDEELKVGIRNPTTDIYNNGYGISELELLISLVTGHLNAEFYNQAYFTQGFSAKGILHIKSAVNRRKLETIRLQWQHMLQGNKNSFQTPIFAGVEDVHWVPLTQKHDDIGFEGWMRYLIKVIGALYQIDPAEFGVGFKDEGAGGGISGDNTQEKINQSKDRGLFPLLRHIENYINVEILAPYMHDVEFEFTGLDSETPEQINARQKAEVTFKKTVNEIREESDLPPLQGMDDIILDTNYMNWYAKYSDKAINTQKMMLTVNDDLMLGKQPDYTEESEEAEVVVKSLGSKKVKPVKIEYFIAE